MVKVQPNDTRPASPYQHVCTRENGNGNGFGSHIGSCLRQGEILLWCLLWPDWWFLRSGGVGKADWLNLLSLVISHIVQNASFFILCARFPSLLFINPVSLFVCALNLCCFSPHLYLCFPTFLLSTLFFLTCSLFFLTCSLLYFSSPYLYFIFPHLISTLFFSRYLSSQSPNLSTLTRLNTKVGWQMWKPAHEDKTSGEAVRTITFIRYWL